MFLSAPLLGINNRTYIPNSISDLNLNSRTILYYNPCSTTTTLSYNYNNSVTVSFFDTSFYVNKNGYGYINLGDINKVNPIITSLRNTTILVDIKTDGLCNFFFGNNSTGNGFMIRNETRNPYSSGIATTNTWTSWTSPSSGPRLTSQVWYTFVVSISPNGNIKWTAQQISGSGLTNQFINNTIYTYNSGTVNQNNVYIGVNGDGGSFYNYFTNIRIYNQALL